MTPETLARVQGAIDSLGFRPSSVARGLVNRRTATVGLIVAEIETPLFLHAVSVIEPIARQAQYNTLVCHASDLSDEKQAVSLLQEKQVDGIIFLSTSEYRDDAHLLALYAAGIPTVLINRGRDHPGFDRINWDNAGGVSAAVTHLVSHGHRRIALLSGPTLRRSTDERLSGYKQALRESGLDRRDDYVQSGDYTKGAEIWEKSTTDLLDLIPRPTAILAADDIVAAVVMRTLQRRGVRIPQDIAVVGFDDQSFCGFLNPALTTVRLPMVEAAQHAMAMLLARINDRATEPRHLLLATSLIVRESSGAGSRGLASVAARNSCGP